MKFFAIQSVKEPTKFLPGYEGRGHTHHEPTHWWIINPRLFMTRVGAARALSAWVKGRHVTSTGTDDDFFGNQYTVRTGVQVEPVPGRKREDFQIVEVTLAISPPTS